MRGLARVVALVGLLPLGAAAAEAPEALLERAVAEYAQALDTPEGELRIERFHRSERLFESVAARGVENPDLWTNAGNAALLAERLGPAVLAYRRALRLDPDHERAALNLEHARTLLPEWVPRPETRGLLDTFFAWHRTWSPSERARSAALLFAATALLAAAAILWRSTLARNLAVVPGLAWLALLVSLAFDPAAALADEVVVTAPETIGRAADSAHAPARLSQPLPAGTELRVVERREGWLRVALANGREAWVTTSSVTPVVPEAETSGSRR